MLTRKVYLIFIPLTEGYICWTQTSWKSICFAEDPVVSNVLVSCILFYCKEVFTRVRIGGVDDGPAGEYITHPFWLVSNLMRSTIK